MTLETSRVNFYIEMGLMRLTLLLLCNLIISLTPEDVVKGVVHIKILDEMKNPSYNF